MAGQVSLEEAQAHLRELIERLAHGEELVITENQQPVARLIRERVLLRERQGPGLCKGMITIVADDDGHLDEFADYMP